MLKDIIKKLSLVKFTENPFISLYLNLSFDLRGRRNYDHFLNKRVNELKVVIKGNREKYESYREDLKKIKRFLNYEVDENTMGVAIFACNAENLFETVELPDAFINQMVISGVPALSQLALKAKLGETLAVVVGDSQSAVVYFSVYGRLIGQEMISRQEEEQVRMRRFTSKVFGSGGRGLSFGGDSSKIDDYEEELTRSFVKDVSESLDKWRIEGKYKYLLLLGNAVFITLLDKFLHQNVRGMLIDKTKIDPNSPESDILKLTKNLYSIFLKEREVDFQKRLVNEVLSDGLAVVGVEPTIDALIKGQVDSLVVSNNLNEQTYRCTNCGFLTVSGRPKKCPVCDSKIVKEDLKESLVYLAERMDTDVNIVEPSIEIKGYGGVGATLRYK